jgi:two-component system osmolarity sensor histidine kinase EnvZ
MIRPRFDGLFARLMLAQVLLFSLVGLLFLIWLTAARAEAAATPYARLLAPDLIRAATTRPDQALAPSASGQPLKRSWTRPHGPLSPNISGGPATSRFIASLSAQGVVTDDARLDWNGGEPVLWLHVLPAGATAVWLAAPLPPILPSLMPYIGFIGLLTMGLVTFVSWHFARRVTRPLEALRNRMQDGVSVHGSTAFSGSSASSEIVAIDAAYRQLLERLEHTERERVLLLAGVSHDLRSPLGRIRLAAEMLPLTPDTQADVSTITRNVDHADRLIGSFLDFVRAGSLELNEAVDLAAVAGEVVARFDLPADRLAFQMKHSGAIVLPKANALLIDRLMFNLIDNALKHGRTPVQLSLSSKAGFVQIDVCDAGPGLPDGQEQLLRQAFARGDVSRASPGLGLGLSVVAQTTARLRGELQFSRDDAGHHACVSLPIA